MAGTDRNKSNATNHDQAVVAGVVLETGQVDACRFKQLPGERHQPGRALACVDPVDLGTHRLEQLEHGSRRAIVIVAWLVEGLDGLLGGKAHRAVPAFFWIRTQQRPGPGSSVASLARSRSPDRTPPRSAWFMPHTRFREPCASASNGQLRRITLPSPTRRGSKPCPSSKSIASPATSARRAFRAADRAERPSSIPRVRATRSAASLGDSSRLHPRIASTSNSPANLYRRSGIETSTSRRDGWYAFGARP